MLQKLLALLVSLLLAITGALPVDVLPGERGDAGEDALPVQTWPDEAGDARPIDVSWTKVDGETVEDSRWGKGSVITISFKVGVQVHPDAAIRLGGEEVPLSPTDVVVITGFEGRFAFEDVGTPRESLRLDGTVDRTSVAPAEADRVTTEARQAEPADGRTVEDGSEERRVQYVRIGGEPVENVGVAPGDASRVVTENPDAPEPVDILARWVAIGGEQVVSYLDGNGVVGDISLKVGPYSDGEAPQLNVSGEPMTLEPGARVSLQGFEGSYLIYQVESGLHRVKLDGIATQVNATSSATAVVDGQKPVADFRYTPTDPTTSHTVSFMDRSYDPDGGRNLLYEWNFGDGKTSIKQDPDHSYEEPGTYNVRLTVTDEDLRQNSTTARIQVENTPPTVDFSWHPEEPNSVEPAKFVSEASDPDGDIVAYEWDFDDGQQATGPDPEHTFPDDGFYEVTHTVIDDAGAESSLTQVVQVQNLPPAADFSWSPGTPQALEEVNLRTTSGDRDGTIEDVEWDLGDGSTASGDQPTHQYVSSGTYEVTLTVTDDDGDTATHTANVTIENRPPEPDFVVLDEDPATGQEIPFEDRSVDRDGDLREWEWSFGDGNTSQRRDPTHAYGSEGTYRVTLTVTDDEGGQETASQIVAVSNGPPDVDFIWTPEEPHTRKRVSFSDLTVDPDGDEDIKSWFWIFGDGNTSTERNPSNTYPDDGVYDVTLHVRDRGNHNVSLTHTIDVRNQVPEITHTSHDPEDPSSRDTVTLTMSAHDPDGAVVDREWELPNGTILEGRTVNATFPAGNHTVVAWAVDEDGARGRATHLVPVDPAGPIANFTTDPEVVGVDQEAQFIDTSEPGDEPVNGWFWRFGDGTRTSGVQNPKKTYHQSGVYDVKLRVSDAGDRTDTITKSVEVKPAPDIEWGWEPESPSTGLTTWFNATGSVPDGEIVNWTWEIEGADPLFGQNVTHVFDQPGDYLVSVTATADIGTETTESAIVEVTNNLPDAFFTFSPALPEAGETVSFSDESDDVDGTIAERIWRFGDGAQDTGEDVNHTYLTSALYTAQLEVVDDDGGTAFHEEGVPVTSPHNVTLQVEVEYPTGEPVDLTLPGIDTSFTSPITGVTRDGGDVTETSQGVSEATFGAGEWVAGESITWRVETSEGFTDTLTITPPHDASFLQRGPVPVLFPFDASLEVALPPDGRTTDRGPQGEAPRYTDLSEPVEASVILVWSTGEPVRNQSLEVDVQYHDLSPKDPFTPSQRPFPEITASTGSDGVANFTVPYTIGFGVDTFLPGWYELEVGHHFRLDRQIAAHFDWAYFLEDPNGLLAEAERETVDRPDLGT